MLSGYHEQLRIKGELYLRIKVRPGAAKTRVKEVMDDDTVKLDVAAPPVKGRANQALIGFLASEFAVSVNNVTIISGAGDRVKLIKVTLPGRADNR